MNNRISLALAAALLSLAGTAIAQLPMATYKITYKTADDKGAGTRKGNKVFLRLTGDSTALLKDGFPSLNPDELQPLVLKQVAPSKGELVTDTVQYPDHGPISHIEIGNFFAGFFPDDWDVQFITIVHVPTGASTHFELAKNIPSNSNSLAFTELLAGAMSGVPDVKRVSAPKRIQHVYFFDGTDGNSGGAPSTEFSHEVGETVGFSKSQEESFDVSASVGGEFLGIGASATVAFGAAKATTEEDIKSKSFSQTVTLPVELPSQAVLIQLFNLDLPFDYENMRFGDDVLRMGKLAGSLQLSTDLGKRIEIPNIDANTGALKVVAWEDVQPLVDIMRLSDKKLANRIETELKQEWIDAGFVFDPNTPKSASASPDFLPAVKAPAPKTKTPVLSTPTPRPEPTPAPAPAPTTATAPKAEPAPKAAPTAAPADLVATFSKFGHANGQVTVRLLVTNRGQTAAPASAAKIYLSRNKNADPRRDTGLGTQTVPALEPGASATVTFRKKMPAEKADGMRLVALLDTGDAVAESNEENSFRPGMKLQADRVGSSERAERKASKPSRPSKKGKKGGKKRRK